MSRQLLEERAAGLRERNDLVEVLFAAKAAYPDYALPKVLKRCTRCGQHAALYQNDYDGGTEFLCGSCGPRKPPIYHYDLRQVAADIALLHKEAPEEDE